MKMKTKLSFKLCQNPHEVGNDKSRYYLLDQWGRRFHFTFEYDSVLNEMETVIKLSRDRYYAGKDVNDVVSQMKNDFIEIKKW